MQWEFIVALVLVIPLILFPVALVWYLNIGGILAVIKERQTARESLKRAQRVTREAEQKEAAETRR